MTKILMVIGVSLFLFWPALVCGEEITIVGTGSGPSILKEIAEAFMQQNPEINIIVPRSIGSGGGIKAVDNDQSLVARVAREIKDSEKHFNLTYTPIARMPIVFYVNRNVPITNLTSEQACGIYSGSILNWQDVGGHNARIKVIRRQDGDSSLSVLLRSFPHFKDITITTFSKTTYSDPDTIDLAENTPDAIAFGSYCDVVNRQLNVLDSDGVSPTDPAYPYFGIFALVYKEENRTGNLKKFIDFASSPAAAQAVIKGGGLPVQPIDMKN